MDDDLLGQFFSEVDAVVEEVKKEGDAEASASATKTAAPAAAEALPEADVEPPAKRRKAEPVAVVVAAAQPAEVVVAAPAQAVTAAPVSAAMAAPPVATAPEGAPAASAYRAGGMAAATAHGGGSGGAMRAQPRPAQAKKTLKRSAGGKSWEDPTLNEWPANDFRLFIGDLGADTSATMLETIFRKYSSFAKAKICRDHARNKVRQFGFVSFLDGMDCMRAMREQQGKYCGQRPMKISKSTWKDRDVGELKKKERRKKQFQKKLGLR